MHPYGSPYPPYGATNPYAQPTVAAPYGHPQPAAAAYPQAAYAPYAAYPPAPGYYNPAGYHAAAPAPLAPIAVAAVEPAVVETAPLSPISAARAKEAAMIALSLEQAARPPPPAAAVAATQPASSAAASSDEPTRDPNELEMKLENAHYNLPEVLGLNLVAHPYYRDLNHITSVEEVVDEIYSQVKHVEPMVAGKDRLPSTALFLLYKLFTLGVTKRQMTELLRHKGSPYIRAIGFLFLRCVYEPKNLWGWFEPFLTDQTVFVPGQQDKTPMTMAAYIRELLEKNEYYGMKLRRIPIPVQRDYQLKLLALEARIKRSAKNEPYRRYLTKGVRLQAEYFQDSKFYDATIDRAMEPLASGNFIVTFLGFGNQEEVDIGALKIPQDIIERAEEEERASRGRPVLKERGAPPIDSATSHRSSDSSRAVASSSRDRDSDRRRDSRERDSRSSSHRDRDGHRSRRSSRSRSRSRSRDRHRSHRSRDRSRDRSSRDRRRRSSRSRSGSRSPSSHSRNGGGDVFSDLPSIGGHGSSSYAASSSSSRARARSLSPEVSLEALLRKERESSVAQGKDYARRPTSFKDSLSMSLLSGTTRKRSRTPPPQRRPDSSVLPPIEEVAAPAKPALSEEQKAARQALLAKYGDAGSARPAPKKRLADDDDDIIRLGM